MTRFDASDPTERRALLADAITAHRRRGSDGATLRADGHEVRFADRTITLTLTSAERERLDTLLGEFPVFKLDQPATRKAQDGTVSIAAIADPKHAADFLERTFREVHGLEADYTLWAVEV